MTRPRRRPSDLRTVSLWWYPAVLLPILVLVAAPLLGWLPLPALVFGLFFLFFWLFSFGFAIYAKLRRVKEPRQ